MNVHVVAKDAKERVVMELKVAQPVKERAE
jgi:hypothetical protein